MIAHRYRAVLTLVVPLTVPALAAAGPLPDMDRDGVVDSGDLCPGTMAAAVVNDNGCSVDQLCACPARNHGDHVSCVAHRVRDFVRMGLHSQRQAVEMVRQAAHSPCTALVLTPTNTPLFPPTSTRTPRPTETPIPGSG